ERPRMVGWRAERRDPEVPVEARLLRRVNAGRAARVLRFETERIADPGSSVARALKLNFVTLPRHHREEAVVVDDAELRDRIEAREKHRDREGEDQRQDDQLRDREAALRHL